jgi:hypothetical protein
MPRLNTPKKPSALFHMHTVSRAFLLRMVDPPVERNESAKNMPEMPLSTDIPIS